MASSSPPPLPRPSPVPPDLLFLLPLLDSGIPPVPTSDSFNFGSLPLVSPSGAEVPSPLPPPELAAARALPSSANKGSWVSKVKSSFQPLVKIASPSVSVDGISSIKAPESITLTSSTVWKDHIVAYFHGLPPSPAKVFNDLNPIWGTNGNISVKNHSKRSCLIFIPCPIIRQWVLDVAFWHSGNCSFTAMLWHPSLNLSDMKLVHAPVWVLFKKVPPELWSLLGFSTMASAVGFPVHSEYPDLKPFSNGVVKLRVVIELDKPRPSLVRVTDKLGNAVSLPVEFLKLPPKCGGCGEHGHLRLRCPQPSVRTSYPAPGYPSYTGVMAKASSDLGKKASVLATTSKSLAHSPLSVRSIGSTNHVGDEDQLGGSSLVVRAVPSDPPDRKLVRSQSLPVESPSAENQAASSGWIRVADRSKTRKSKQTSSTGHRKTSPISSSKFAEEEEMISAAQGILRSRLAALSEKNRQQGSTTSRRQQRKKIRQKIELLTSASDNDLSSASLASVSRVPTNTFGLASGGQSHSRSAHLPEA